MNKDKNYSEHISTTIIDPNFAVTDLNKGELLHLLGAGSKEDMLNACDEALDWIKSLPEGVQGQWIWDNCPTPYWYSWLLTELWEAQEQTEGLRHLEPDYFDLGYAIFDWLAESTAEPLDSELRTTVAWKCWGEWAKAANAAHERRITSDREKINGHWAARLGGDTRFDAEYAAYLKMCAASWAKRDAAIEEANRLFESSCIVRAIYEKWAEEVRKSGMLPQWSEVREVLRTFYRLNSIYANQ